MDRRPRKVASTVPGYLSSSSSSSTSTTDEMVKVHISDLKRPKASASDSARGTGGAWARNYRRATVEDVDETSDSSRKAHRKTKDRHVHFKPRVGDHTAGSRRRRPRDPESWHHSGSSSSDIDTGGIDNDARSTTSSGACSPSPKPVRSSLKQSRARKTDKPIVAESTAAPTTEQQATAAPVYQQQTGYMLVPGPHPGTQQIVPVQVSTGKPPEHQQQYHPGYDATGMGPAQLLGAQLQQLQLQQQGMYGMMTGQAICGGGGGGYYYPGAGQVAYHPMQYPMCPASAHPYHQPHVMQAPMQVHYPQQQPQQQQPMYQQPGYLAPGPAIPDVEPGGTPVQYSTEQIPAFQAPGMHNMGGYFNN